MRYSRARIRFLSRAILSRCKEENAFESIAKDNLITNNIIDTIENYFAIEDEVYEKVMNNLESRKKKLVPGSMEWKIAFDKAYEEEMSRRLLK